MRIGRRRRSAGAGPEELGQLGDLDRRRPIGHTRGPNQSLGTNPACAEGGWHTRVGSERAGVDCGDATPSAEQQEIPDKPTCDGVRDIYGCGCDAGHPAGALAMAWIVGFMLLRRRREA